LSETLDLLAMPAMQRRLGIDAASAARTGDWLHEAGVRHGRGGGDAQSAPFSWRFGLDRLLLGMASGESDDAALPEGDVPDGSLFEGISALPRIEGAASDALDAVLQLNTRIDRHALALSQPKTATQWRQA